MGPRFHCSGVLLSLGLPIDAVVFSFGLGQDFLVLLAPASAPLVEFLWSAYIYPLELGLVKCELFIYGMVSFSNQV